MVLCSTVCLFVCLLDGLFVCLLPRSRSARAKRRSASPTVIVHARARSHTRTHTPTRARARAHAHTHARTFTHAHTRIHTGAHARAPFAGNASGDDETVAKYLEIGEARPFVPFHPLTGVRSAWAFASASHPGLWVRLFVCLIARLSVCLFVRSFVCPSVVWVCMFVCGPQAIVDFLRAKIAALKSPQQQRVRLFIAEPRPRLFIAAPVCSRAYSQPRLFRPTRFVLCLFIAGPGRPHACS